MFSTRRVIAESLWFHRNVNLAVGLGVMAATAVLTGALLIGDSVRGSLRSLVTERLGKIQAALVGDHFFREELAAEVAAHPTFAQHYSAAVPATFLPVSLDKPDPQTGATLRRASSASLLGCDARFWQLGEIRTVEGQVPPKPQTGEVILNEVLASELDVKVGDLVTLRLPEISQIPRDSALARKTDTVTSLARRKVIAIVAASGLGRFGLYPTQQLPRLAYVDLQELETDLRQFDSASKRGFVNTIFVAGEPSTLPVAEAAKLLEGFVRPTLDDYGLSVAAVEPGGYYELVSNRMLIPAPAVRAAEAAFPKVDRQPVLTYLANRIEKGEKFIPYSTVAGIDFVAEPPLGPFRSPTGETIRKLEPKEIALNQWAADDLQANIGDEITLTFFEPESTHGQTQERKETFILKAIIALEGLAADRHLTPDFPGITDEADIVDWDPPFTPFHREWVRSPGIDEDYWDKYRATPKAFLSLAEAQDLFGSRFGNVTSIRLRAPHEVASTAAPSDVAGVLGQRLLGKIDPVAMGFVLQPIQAQQLAAASGSTPFDLLFLGFSFFIIAAAVMLVALLFRLGVESRASEVGILLAVGLSLGRVARLLAYEGIIVSAIGALAGVFLGIGYAWVMLAALRSPDFWLAAVSTPFLQLHWTERSLAIGYASGVIICGGVILYSSRHLGRIVVRRLLSGEVSAQEGLTARPSTWQWVTAGVGMLGAIALIPYATQLEGEAQAGAFFGSGALVLLALLMIVWARLRRAETGGPLIASRGVLFRFAARNAARNPGRSVLTVGLVASAAFLIVAMSAFRIDSSQIAIEKESGNGGFSLVASTDLPLLVDPNRFADPEVQQQLNLSPEDATQLAGSQMFLLRVKPGDDASCLNLYQTRQPRVLGVPSSLIDRGGFAWAGSIATAEADAKNPWRLLDAPPRGENGVLRIPIVLDAATAQYSLKVGLGGTLTIQTDRGQPLALEVVGLLKNSTLQGDVLLSERNFLRYFPDQVGYRMFLIETPPGKGEEVASIWENALGELGFHAESSAKRLQAFLAVQNTYLLTFQSLGGLGLLLGTFGLATVQMRNVLERRGELALMRATGFRRRRLARLVMLENILLLVGGLLVGCLAALVSISPHLASGSAVVPWLTLASTLSVVLVVGILAGLASVWTTLTMPLLPALRGEA